MSNESSRNDPHIIISGGSPAMANALKRRMVERGVPANEVKVSADSVSVAGMRPVPVPTDRADQVGRQAEVDLEVAHRTAALYASARRLVNLTYEQAEAQYHDGRVNQLEFEAYQTAWRRGGHHLGAGTAAGAERPQEPEVERLVAALLSCVADRGKRGSGSAPPPPPAPLLAPRRSPEVDAPPDAKAVIPMLPGSAPVPYDVVFPKRLWAPRRHTDGPTL